MIAKCENTVQGSMRLVKADREVTNRKERKEQQKHVLATQKKHQTNKTPPGMGTSWKL